MTRNEIYDFLKVIIHNIEPGFQFVKAYLSRDAKPKPGVDFAILNVITTQNVGLPQDRHIDIDSETDLINVASDQTRVYRVQFDYYGPNAANNADRHSHILHDALKRYKSQNFGLRQPPSDVRDLTELLENKDFRYRYSFDLHLFAINTITRTSAQIKTAVIEKVIITGK